MSGNNYPHSELSAYVEEHFGAAVVQRITEIPDEALVADPRLTAQIKAVTKELRVKLRAMAEETNDPFTALQMRQLFERHSVSGEIRRDLWERVLVNDFGALNELPSLEKAGIPPDFTMIRIASYFGTPWNMHSMGDFRSALPPITQGKKLFGLQSADASFSEHTGDIHDLMQCQGGQKWMQLVRSTDPDRPFFPNPKGINATFDFAEWVLHLRSRNYTVEFDV